MCLWLSAVCVCCGCVFVFVCCGCICGCVCGCAVLVVVRVVVGRCGFALWLCVVDVSCGSNKHVHPSQQSQITIAPKSAPRWLGNMPV